AQTEYLGTLPTVPRATAASPTARHGVEAWPAVIAVLDAAVPPLAAVTGLQQADIRWSVRFP
ncbi:MAG TPA: hypothetical protein VME44_01815, partial [Streptosporangiaceae bacterium]|nr:hypothetical protein [Streptosporangiaceae bacterium]